MDGARPFLLCKSHIESVLTDGNGKGKERWGNHRGMNHTVDYSWKGKVIGGGGLR